MNVEYLRLDPAQPGDFRELIPGNVLEELAILEDSAMDGVYVFGALSVDEEMPVGAAVAAAFPDREFKILSLLVLPDYRRQGIGSGLMENILTAAYQTFRGEVAENEILPVFLHADYALPGEDAAVFESFLKKSGFTDFESYLPIRIFESEALKSSGLSPAFGKDFRPASSVHTLAEAAGDDPDSVRDFLAFLDQSADPGLCFFTGSAEAPDCFLLASHGDENDLDLVCRLLSDRGKQDVRDLFMALLHALSLDYDSFTLIADGEKNDPEDFFRTLAENTGESCPHGEAGMYIIFE